MNAKRQVIYDTLIEILCENWGVVPEFCTEGTVLYEDLIIESVDFLVLSQLIEDEFDVEFPTEAFSELLVELKRGASADDLALSLEGGREALHMKTDARALTGYEPFDRALYGASLRALFTVGYLVDYIMMEQEFLFLRVTLLNEFRPSRLE